MEAVTDLKTMYTLALIIMTLWLVANVIGTVMVGRNIRKSEDMYSDFKTSCELESHIINILISRNGIEQTLEDLKDAGYQVSADDASPTNYTLYDPSGKSINLRFKP